MVDTKVTTIRQPLLLFPWSNCTIFNYQLQPTSLLVCNMLTVSGSVCFVIQFLETVVLEILRQCTFENFVEVEDNVL